ncbi:unnamed protein product [Closterium sp. Naga37s-1]|nr:unnamed protein product [Closterium sp. Naga37s-1]
MGKGRSNKSNKKAADNVADKETADAPDVPVKDPTAGGKSQASSSSAPVIGPFEALSDLQHKADNGTDSGVKDQDEEGGLLDNSQDSATEDGLRDEATTAEKTHDDEDAPSMASPDEEDDGYLSDDSDEHLEPDSLNSVIALKRFSLTLLVPFSRKVEVKRAAVTVAAMLDEWREHLTQDALLTTTYQDLTAVYFSGERYGRLQVTFNQVRDANFVWNQVIRHECVNGDFIDLTWQHPEDARFLRERVLNPTAKEVVVKGVPADITAELVRRLLVVSKLVKRGRSAFASGFGFHRTVDPVTGLDTDRIRGLLIPHVDDEYRWRDPAVILTSTGGAREEWVCVQTVCEKAQGNRFEQASAHIASARHKGGLKKEVSANRASVFSQKMLAFKKEYTVKPTK